MGGARFVAEQDPAGIILGRVIAHDGVIDADKVDAFPAIFGFLRLKTRQVGGTSRWVY